MSSATVQSLAELEAAVGSRPAAAMLKSIGWLDEHCRDYLARSTYAVMGAFGGPGDAAGSLGSAGLSAGVRMLGLGGSPGFLTVAGRTRLGLPEQAAALPDGASAGLLALVPGYRETLRVNGRIVQDPSGPALEVAEAFLHCAKCMIRSELWAPVPEVAPVPTAPVPVGAAVSPGTASGRTAVGAETGETVTGTNLDVPGVRDFLERMSFVTLASIDAAGGADVSPKGDPAGFVQPLDARTLLIPDRPGNRRTDTFHNLIEDDRIGLLGLVRGEDRTLRVSGTARITTDQTLRERLEVKGNVPKVAVVLEVDHVELGPDTGLAAADLWEHELQDVAAGLPRASRIWTDHVKLNTDPGLAAAATRRLANEKVLAAGLAMDYKSNLY